MTGLSGNAGEHVIRGCTRYYSLNTLGRFAEAVVEAALGRRLAGHNIQ